jgi:hypothetical protein
MRPGCLRCRYRCRCWRAAAGECVGEGAGWWPRGYTVHVGLDASIARRPPPACTLLVGSGVKKPLTGQRRAGIQAYGARRCRARPRSAQTRHSLRSGPAAIPGAPCAAPRRRPGRVQCRVSRVAARGGPVWSPGCHYVICWRCFSCEFDTLLPAAHPVYRSSCRARACPWCHISFVIPAAAFPPIAADAAVQAVPSRAMRRCKSRRHCLLGKFPRFSIADSHTVRVMLRTETTRGLDFN